MACLVDHDPVNIQGIDAPRRGIAFARERALVPIPDRRGPDDTRKPDHKHGGRYQFPNSFNGLYSLGEFPIYALRSTEGFSGCSEVFADGPPYFWYVTVGFTGLAVIFTSREGSISTLGLVGASVASPEISYV